ncbi:MAG: TonB-dependent receptor [Verrucomicrobiota bacterium]
MNPPLLHSRAILRLVHNLSTVLIIMVGLVASALHAADPGTAAGGTQPHFQISGRVLHAGTKQFLSGATVELVGRNQTTLTDTVGRFEFGDLPPGSYTVSVAYTGLDTQQQTVELSEATSAPLLFRMESGVLQLETFQVTTEKEGHAAAIQRQRNSTNMITAAATDAFGALASQNPGEIFMRLPGVAATIGEDNEPSAVSIRGMASRLNAVSTDGGMLAPVSSGATRQVRFTTNSTNQYEEFEVVKGLRPDMDGSSVGGTLNMKTKSPLKTTLDQEFTYKVGARWAPPFAEHNPTRRDRPIHPDVAFGYTRVFDILGGKRNFALSLNSTYFESVGDYTRTIRDYQFTNDVRAYVWDYQAADYYFNRKLKTFSGRADYQLTPNTLLSFRGAMNYYDAWGGHLFNQARAFTNRTVATLDSGGNPTGTGAILPSYTDKITEVRPVTGSRFSLSSNSIGQIQEQRSFQLVAEHHKDRLEVDLNFNYALGRLNQLSGQRGDKDNGGSFTATINNVGYKLDMTNSVNFPDFTQTAGPSIYDINNYTTGTLTQTGSRRDAHIYSARGDVKYDLGTAHPAYLKTGFSLRRQDSKMVTKDDRSLVYVGPDGKTNTADDTLAPFLSKLKLDSDYKLGPLPLIDVRLLASDLEKNPGNWSENLYFREQRRYTGTNAVTEDVSAGYLMGNIKLGKFTALGGVRYEYTEVNSSGSVLTQTRADITDPVLRAATEYSPRQIHGTYDDLLPSLHLSYAIRPNFTARASWSTGIGRPEFSNLVPVETVNSTAQTVTVSNPSLKPQGVTNWDLSLEYYLRPMGLISAAVFEKDMTDFQFTAAGGTVGNGPDNGFGGNYAGYVLNTTLNGGKARVRGLELSWQQQVNFGPNWLRKFGFFANYTRITAEGDYGTGAAQGVTQLAEFVPETWNVGLRFARGRFRANYLVNYTGEYLFAYSADPTRLRYKTAFTNTTISTSWAFKPSLEAYLDAYNVFDKSQTFYYGVPSHRQQYSIKGMMLSFGVRGRF